jgi:hypothetical protein
VKLSGEGQIHSIFFELCSQEVQSHTQLSSRCCNTAAVSLIALSLHQTKGEIPLRGSFWAFWASSVRFLLTKYYDTDLGEVLMKYSSIFLATCWNLS